MSQLFYQHGIELDHHDQTLWVTGPVGATTAAALAAAGNAWLASTSSRALHINFESVDMASSAALSVLLEWMRVSRQYSLCIESVALSAPLRRLADLAELETLLMSSASKAAPA